MLFNDFRQTGFMSHRQLGFIIPTHNNLRSPELVKELESQIKSGRVFRTGKIQLFYLTHDCCDRIYCLDGHHRLCAMYNVGSDLLAVEAHLELYSLNDLRCLGNCEGQTRPQHSAFNTPFDPETECRLADFSKYRKLMKELDGVEIGQIPRKELEAMYKEPRKIFTIQDLCNV